MFIICTIILLWVGFSSSKALSQQLIISVPNAEITHQDEYTLTVESQLKVNSPKFGTENFLFLTRGIGHDTELALSAYEVKLPRANNFIIAPGFKTSKQIFASSLKQNELKLTIGQMVPISLRRPNIGSWTYSHLSLKVPKLKNLRVSAGPNFGTKNLFGRNQVSAMVGVEQPITKKLTFVADWVSGTHNFGALAAGFQYNFNSRTALLGAYKIPNNSRSGESAIIIEFIKHF